VCGCPTARSSRSNVWYRSSSIPVFDLLNLSSLIHQICPSPGILPRVRNAILFYPVGSWRCDWPFHCQTEKVSKMLLHYLLRIWLLYLIMELLYCYWVRCLLLGYEVVYIYAPYWQLGQLWTFCVKNSIMNDIFRLSTWGLGLLSHAGPAGPSYAPLDMAGSKAPLYLTFNLN